MCACVCVLYSIKDRLCLLKENIKFYCHFFVYCVHGIGRQVKEEIQLVHVSLLSTLWLPCMGIDT